METKSKLDEEQGMPLALQQGCPSRSVEEVRSGRPTPLRIRLSDCLARGGGAGVEQGESTMVKKSDCLLIRDLRQEFELVSGEGGEFEVANADDGEIEGVTGEVVEGAGDIEEESGGAGEVEASGGGARDGRRRGRGGHVGWSEEERKSLWECYTLSGGKSKRGYTSRMKELWDQRNLTPRSKASLVTQLGTIEGGGLTRMVREEIEHKVARCYEVIDELDNSGNGSFHGFGDGGMTPIREVEERDEDAVEVVEAAEVAEVVFEGRAINIDVQARVERNVDTWRNGDGSIRVLSEKETEVLAMLREVQNGDSWEEVPSLKAVDSRKVKSEVALVEGVMHNLIRKGMDVTEVNRLLYSGGVVVAKRLGMTIGKKKRKAPQKPYWERRVEMNVNRWRKELGQVEEIGKGSKVKDSVREGLEKKYNLVERGTVGVSTELKNRIKAGSTKLRLAKERMETYRQNNLFKNSQAQFYKGLGCQGVKPCEPPNAEESLDLWRSLWSESVEHNRDASWMEEIRSKFDRVRQMDDVVVSIAVVKAGIKRMKNWKAPGPDGVRGFWFKKLLSLHECLTEALQVCLSNGEVPGWMVKGRTVLIQKDPAKGTVAGNYRPIACLPLMWKLLTGIFAEQIYDHLLVNDLLPEEQKGCRKNSRGTKDQLLIDKAVLKDAKVRQRFLSMAWIDYRKAYDMLPHSWIIETLNIIKVARNVDDLLKGSMKDWKTVLTSGEEILGEVDIRRGIFQGDSLSPLLFIVAMLPLTELLRREEDKGYLFGTEGKRINHLLFMDDLKLFSGKKEDLASLIKVVKGFSKDIGMKFGYDKCAWLTMEAGKEVECGDIELPDGSKIQSVDEEGYKYLGVLEGAGIKVAEMKEKVRSEYYRRVKLVARSKLNAGNLITAVNVWAVSVVRYTAGVLDWTKDELEAMDIRTRKILTMNGAFHAKSSVDRLYMKRNVGGRGLIGVQFCVESEEHGLKEYVLASEEWMLKAAGSVLRYRIEKTKKDYVLDDEKGRHNRLMEEKVKTHGKFWKVVKDVGGTERTWQWLRGGHLKKGLEGFICAAHERVLKTRQYKVETLKQPGSKLCRLCHKFNENVAHLSSGCGELAQVDYRRRHDKMGLRVYWELLGKYGLKRNPKWYEQTVESVRKSEDGLVEIWWDRPVATTKQLDHNRPDVVVIDKREDDGVIVDFSVPIDVNVAKVEVEKVNRYDPLRVELERIYGVKMKVIAVVVGALGTVTKKLETAMVDLGIPDVIGGLQISALVGTAAIMRRVLSSD